MSQPSNTAVTDQQGQQAALTSLLATGMGTAWGLLDLTDLARTMPRYEAAVAALVYKYGQASAAVAARWYRTQRHDAGVTGRFIPHGADPAGIGQVQASLGWATRELWQPSPDVAAVKTLANGVAQKMVVDTGRNTLIAAIEQDTKCRGWAREARPGACSFCALLSTRGAVYRSEDTAKFQAHDHCHCVPVPLFADYYEPPAHVREWQRIYRDAPYGSNAAQARNNFRVALEQARTGQLVNA